MKTHVKLGLAMLAGFGLGAGAVHELHAEATPPAYVISEIDVVDRQRPETARIKRQYTSDSW